VRIIRIGDEGPEVHDIQQRLISLGGAIEVAELDGRFGSSTEAAVRSFQERRSLPVDGRVGADTWEQLVEAGYALGDRTLYIRHPIFRGDDVLALQRKLNALGFDAGKEDGLFGSMTDRAVREFQRNVGDEPDGIVGLDTLAIVERMRPQEVGPGRAVVRETETLRALRELPIEGQVVAIDPAHGEDEPGSAGYALASVVAARLSKAGAKAVLVRHEDEDPTPSDRARAANELGASVCLSLHLSSGEAGASGPTCSYFGTSTTHSPAGKVIAELILEELQRELGREGRLGRLSRAILRETRMPAVQIEPLGGADLNERSDDPDLSDRVARAVTTGLRRFFAG
jgi:N-acetylmuramoyl-L-alanine amidase